MTFENALADELVKQRKKRGITQSELAKLAKLDRTYISLIERGERHPTVKVCYPG